MSTKELWTKCLIQANQGVTTRYQQKKQSELLLLSAVSRMIRLPLAQHT
jgi:hypothetical protein